MDSDTEIESERGSVPAVTAKKKANKGSEEEEGGGGSGDDDEQSEGEGKDAAGGGQGATKAKPTGKHLEEDDRHATILQVILFIYLFLKHSEEDDGDTTILQVHLHGTDELKAHIHLRHPVIRLSIVNASDGSLMKKPRPGRNVVQQHENSTVLSTPGMYIRAHTHTHTHTQMHTHTQHIHTQMHTHTHIHTVPGSTKSAKGGEKSAEEGEGTSSPTKGASKGFDRVLPVKA